MKSALVTGATGYIGQNLARRLRGAGWSVSALVRPNSRPADLPGIKILIYDGSTESVLSALAQTRPDVVFHLASLFTAEHKPADVKPLVESNLLFSCQLAEAMAQSKVKLLVNTGTAWQNFGNATYNPVNLYAATKQAFESILAYYQEAHGLRMITLKIFDTYGPNDPRPKLLALFQRARNETLAFSAGGQHIDLVHIEDVLKAFIMAAKRLMNGQVKRAEVYALSSKRTLSLRQVAKIFEEASNSRLRINWGARPYRIREVMRPWSKGRRLPGWKPKISLEAGFRRLSVRGPASLPAVF